MGQVVSDRVGGECTLAEGFESGCFYLVKGAQHLSHLESLWSCGSIICV